MNPEQEQLAKLREQEYAQRLATYALRRAVYGQPDPAASAALLDDLQGAEQALSALELQLAAAGAGDPRSNGVIVDTGPGGTGYEVRGAGTTRLSARAVLRMAQVPTSIYHLLDAADHPLVSCTVHNVDENTRRLRVSCRLEGYSAPAVDTVELAPDGQATLDQLPTLFPHRLRGLSELTAATVTVLIEDLDGRVELHRTQPVRLLAGSTVPFAVRDPATGHWADLSRYLGAFVTPNAPEVMRFLREVADHHPKGHLVGYQVGPDEVTAQVKAIFEALRAAGIAYVNSVVAFSPEEGTATQRVRLPRESLADREANCVDGTVLVASLIEALTMNPALVVVPGHAFVAWESWSGSGEWRYLETTMIGSTATFEEACASADRTAGRYRQLVTQTGDESKLRLWPLRVLRATHGITPAE